MCLKQIDYTTSFEFDAKSTSGFYDHVMWDEKIMIVPSKQSLSYCSIVFNLYKIDSKVDQNYNFQSSMIYNHIAEQVEHHNMPYQKITCPNESYSIAFGLQLHSMSDHYDGLRNKCNLMLLP